MNKLVLEQIKPDMSLESKITKLCLAHFGHIIRRERTLKNNITVGRTEGTRKGKPAIQWLDTIIIIMKKTLADLSILAHVQSSYRLFIYLRT